MYFYNFPDKLYRFCLPSGMVVVIGGHGQQAMVGAVEGFGGKAGDLPLHQPCGGSAVCV
jgi:hypothetical protein